MCGIAGFVDFGGSGSKELARIGHLMGDALGHRGPDADGIWTDVEAGVVLAHRRLAIRDLTPTGGQPMVTTDGRFVLTYNGEIYDTPPLRRELEARGRGFRGSSDSEVLLNACAEWGTETAVRRFNGMFAFALWDRQERRLTLVRDRMGIKPLYWAAQGNLFLFASELKALGRHPRWQPSIDRNAVAAFMRLSYVPAPHCIWKNAHKLEPGCILTVDRDGNRSISRYWDMAEVAFVGRRDINLAEATEELDSLVRGAVSRRLVSDVPLGVFLSGGIDSSTVAAVAQAVSQSPVKTFSIGFAEADYDEGEDAARVAVHLGADHHRLLVTPKQAWDCLPDLPGHHDEPFADSSQIPLFLLSQFARRSVTVVLSGDGGDEVLGGYNRYLWAARVLPVQRLLPLSLRRWIRAALGRVSPRNWDRLGGLIRSLQAGEKLQKMASLLAVDDIGEAYRILSLSGGAGDEAVPGGTCAQPLPLTPPLIDPALRMQYWDSLGYLPDDILTKVDRASMAWGLEARIPLLDPAIVRFGFSLPLPLRVAGSHGKVALRAVLARYLPAPLFDSKPKTGFSVPIGAWLRGPLRPWADDLLQTTSSADEFLDRSVVERWWREHLSGRARHDHVLWNALTFRAWCAHQEGRSRVSLPYAAAAAPDSAVP